MEPSTSGSRYAATRHSAVRALVVRRLLAQCPRPPGGARPRGRVSISCRPHERAMTAVAGAGFAASRWGESLIHHPAPWGLPDSDRSSDPRRLRMAPGPRREGSFWQQRCIMSMQPLNRASLRHRLSRHYDGRAPCPASQDISAPTRCMHARQGRTLSLPSKS